MVPFIPVPVPSGCRRIDTSTQTDSGGDLRHAFPAWCRSFLRQYQAGVEESTLQPKLVPEVISGTNLQHGAVHSCASAKRVSKTRHFNHTGPEVISGTNLQPGAVHSCASAKRVSKTRHFNHTGPEAISGTDIQYDAVHPCASAKRVSKNRHFNPNWIRR